MTSVVVSVGTDHHPFNRMMDWMTTVQSRLDLDLFVQRGATSPRDGMASVDYVSAQELAQLMRDADAVVCHGGPGTMSLAQVAGHRPIVVPRDPGRREHVDDHQMRYTARLAAEGRIDVARSIDDLTMFLSMPRSHALGSQNSATHAVEQFSELMDRLLAGDLPKRPWRERTLVRRAP